MSDLRVSIRDDLCTGHGRCYALAPDVFDADDDGRGVVKIGDVPASLHDAVRLAERNCPERAVVVEETD